MANRWLGDGCRFNNCVVGDCETECVTPSGVALPMTARWGLGDCGVCTTTLLGGGEAGTNLTGGAASCAGEFDRRRRTGDSGTTCLFTSLAGD